MPILFPEISVASPLIIAVYVVASSSDVFGVNVIVLSANEKLPGISVEPSDNEILCWVFVNSSISSTKVATMEFAMRKSMLLFDGLVETTTGLYISDKSSSTVSFLQVESVRLLMNLL